MSGGNESGCGCLTLVLEAIAFMLICNFIGCEWAKEGTRNLVGYARELWDGGAKDAAK